MSIYRWEKENAALVRLAEERRVHLLRVEMVKIVVGAIAVTTVVSAGLWMLLMETL